MTKRERLAVFFGRMSSLPPATSAAEAFAQIVETFTTVENELCTSEDDRMFPPSGAYYSDASREGLDVYRQTRHDTLIASNGAIAVRVRSSREWIFEKAGANGRKVEP